MKRIIPPAAAMLVLTGCVGPPSRPTEYPPPARPAHHVPSGAASEQTAEKAVPRAADVKPLGQGELTPQTVESYMDAQEKNLRATLRGSGSVVSRVGDDLAVIIPADSLFVGDTDALSDKGRRVLTRIALDARKFDSTRISVSGFTDSRQMPAQAKQKSTVRAEAVKNALAAGGVDSHRIEAKGLGAENAIVPTAGNVAEPRNRRIEIEISPRMKA